MANTDIFNPNTGFSPTLGFNPNWNYGSPRKTAANYQTQRPRWGTWNSRSVGNGGYSFDLVFIDRPIEQVRYIRTFYEQFQRGFFTLIDWDSAVLQPREHVGRFTSYAADTETANLKYTIRVTFEEVPAAPMRNYPQAFNYFGHWLYVVDDFMNAQAATFATGPNPWVVQQTPAAVAGNLPATNPANLELYEIAPASGDYAQIEYVGWGFKMIFPLAQNLGICSVLLDGIPMVTGLDLTNGQAASVNATYATYLGGVAGPGVVVNPVSVPLGRHRVMVMATGNKNASATSNDIIFPALQVIH